MIEGCIPIDALMVIDIVWRSTFWTVFSMGVILGFMIGFMTFSIIYALLDTKSYKKKRK